MHFLDYVLDYLKYLRYDFYIDSRKPRKQYSLNQLRMKRIKRKIRNRQLNNK